MQGDASKIICMSISLGGLFSERGESIRSQESSHLPRLAAAFEVNLLTLAAGLLIGAAFANLGAMLPANPLERMADALSLGRLQG